MIQKKKGKKKGKPRERIRFEELEFEETTTSDDEESNEGEDEDEESGQESSTTPSSKLLIKAVRKTKAEMPPTSRRIFRKHKVMVS